MIRVGDKTVALRGVSRVSVGARVVFDAATSGGGGGGFTVTLDPSPATGATASSSTQSVTTQTCEATPEGGVAPYAYAWTRIAGLPSWSALSPSSKSTPFRCSSVPASASLEAEFQVTVTDARGATAIASVTAVAQNFGGLSDVGNA